MTEIALFIISILLWFMALVMAAICGMANGRASDVRDSDDQQFAGFCAVVSVTLATCAYVVTVAS